MIEQKTAIRQLKELKRQGSIKKMRLAAEGWREEWQTLIAILMSARTRDEVTVIVAENLFSEYKTLRAVEGESARCRPHHRAGKLFSK